MSDVNLDVLRSLGWDAHTRVLFAEIARPDSLPGRVVRVERSACVVALADGDHLAATRVAGAVAVGDWAAVSARWCVHRYRRYRPLVAARSG